MVYAIAAVAIALVVAWNVYPPLRRILRGWSTIAEGAIGVALYYFDIFASVIEEARVNGYLPDDFEKYTPIILMLWVVVKRRQTTTAMGKSE